MRTRMPAALLLLLCVLAPAGWHTDAAARSAAHILAAKHDIAAGQPPYDDGLPRLHAGAGAQAAAGSLAVLPVAPWQARDRRGAPAGPGYRGVPAQQSRSTAPARAPPASTTR